MRGVYKTEGQPALSSPQLSPGNKGLRFSYELTFSGIILSNSAKMHPADHTSTAVVSATKVVDEKDNTHASDRTKIQQK